LVTQSCGTVRAGDGSGDGDDKIGFVDADARPIFHRSCAAEPDIPIEQFKKDEATAEADTLTADRTQPARRRLQCIPARGDLDSRRAAMGMVLTERSA